MRTVSDFSEIQSNMAVLDHYLLEGSGEEREFAVKLIKAGRCFLVCRRENGFSFYPSRFIGYIENSMWLHRNHSEKDGRITNVAITKILYCQPVQNADMETEFQKYCLSLGVSANHYKHSFWII